MKPTNICVIFLTGLIFTGLNALGTSADAPQTGSAEVLAMDQFINLATANDKEFEKILIDQMPLRYRRDLNLPAKDIVLGVKREHDFVFNQTEEVTETTMSLSKLFPSAGADLSAEYTRVTSVGSAKNSSEFTFTVSLPIARNAFGKSTRLKDKIIGLEVDLAKHQVVEAYEDYLAAVINIYYDWYAAHENLRIAESSYNENLRLLDNMREKQRSNIALAIDVNKINLQVLAKKEILISFREKYEGLLNLVKQVIRYQGGEELIPAIPAFYDDTVISFDSGYQAFKKESRTYAVLDLLEDKSSLEVAKNADELLPSIDLNLGYTMEGENLDINEKDNTAFLEVSLEWPFPSQVEKAGYQVSKIALEKTRLAAENAYSRLETGLKNLVLQLDRQDRLSAIAREKIDLAEAILADEIKNYSLGKITLNDYISAVNLLDTNRFNSVSCDIQKRKLIVEWLRLTDRLVRKSDIPGYH